MSPFACYSMWQLGTPIWTVGWGRGGGEGAGGVVWDEEGVKGEEACVVQLRASGSEPLCRVYIFLKGRN